MLRLQSVVSKYGNVMASRGSVIPLWVDQIKGGNHITITDPGMTRYMMTLDDAVDLVLYAFENGNQGDLFVQKAPAATLDVLADALKELYNADTSVKIIGTRHGEKLYETLVTREEMFRSEDMPQTEAAFSAFSQTASLNGNTSLTRLRAAILTSARSAPAQ